MRALTFILVAVLMAIVQRGVTSANTAGTPAAFVTVAPPTGYANGDMARLYIAIDSSAGAGIVGPPGWAVVPGYPVGTVAPSRLIYVFARHLKAADPSAGWSWVFDKARNCVAVMYVAYDDAGGFVRACNGKFITYASEVNFATDSTLVSNVADQAAVVAYVAGQQDTWSLDSAEVFDDTTSSGTDDLCMAVGEVLPVSAGGISAFTGSLDSAVGTSGIAIVEVLTIGGMVHALGTGSSLVIHDSAKMYNATDWSMEEVCYSFPNHWEQTGVQAGRKQYSQGPSSAGWTIGSASSPQPTTWKEKNAIIFGTAPTYVNSNHSNWRTEWDGVTFVATNPFTMRGHMVLDDYEIDPGGTTSLLPGAAGLDSSLTNGKLKHKPGAGGILTVGSSTFPVATFEDNTVLYDQGTGNDACAGIFATVNRNNRFKCANTRAWFSANAANAFRCERPTFEGVPTEAFVRWGGSSVDGWRTFGGVYEEGSTKYKVGSSGNPTLAKAHIDGGFFYFWYIDAAGAPLVGKRLKVTDAIGGVPINVLSDANGFCSFSFEEFAQGIPLLDNYAVGTVATRRFRTPLKIEMNPVGDPNYDGSLQSITHLAWPWPTTAPITNTTGSFRDVIWVQVLGPPVVGGGPPSPITVDAVPIAAPTELRFQVAVPDIL